MAPIIIADSGCKVPFYRVVKHWRWVGRVRGLDFLRPRDRWVRCKTLFESDTATPTAWGGGEWVGSIKRNDNDGGAAPCRLSRYRGGGLAYPLPLPVSGGKACSAAESAKRASCSGVAGRWWAAFQSA